MTAPANNNRANERGNAFLYILIGVALFAALMFSFTRSARQGGENISSKKTDIAAVDVIGYGQRVSRAVSLLIQNGCSESQLDFANNIYTQVNGTAAQATGHNAGATANCAVFGPNTGLAAEIASPDASATSASGWGAGWLNPGNGRAYEAVVNNIGTASPDLLYIISGLRHDVCARINDKLGVTNTGGEPPVEDDAGMTAFDGAVNGTGIFGNDDANVAGKRSFCYQTTTSPPFYAFVNVVIER